ncbi:MAG: cytochrome c oxidase assembly protein [Candidatus Binatia bacterium]
MEDVHPSVVAGVLICALLYGGALWRGRHRRVPLSQVAAFAGALATIFLALDGPVDALADDRLFSAHMLQHLLLALAMPPLLLLGTPAWMLRPLLRWRAVKWLAKFLTYPIVAFTLYNGFLAAIHTPPIFEQMVRDETTHIAMHLALMITGTIMWWPLLSPLPELPRLTYPAQTLYLFLLLIPMAAVSAPIALASQVIYPWYLEGPHPGGLTPLADQVLGGLLMWVGAGLYFMCVFSIMFFRWAQREDRDEPVAGRPLTVLRAIRVGPR